MDSCADLEATKARRSSIESELGSTSKNVVRCA